MFRNKWFSFYVLILSTKFVCTRKKIVYTIQNKIKFKNIALEKNIIFYNMFMRRDLYLVATNYKKVNIKIFFWIFVILGMFRHSNFFLHININGWTDLNTMLCRYIFFNRFQNNTYLENV